MQFTISNLKRILPFLEQSSDGKMDFAKECFMTSRNLYCHKPLAARHKKYFGDKLLSDIELYVIITSKFLQVPVLEFFLMRFK